MSINVVILSEQQGDCSAFSRLNVVSMTGYWYEKKF